MQTMRKTQLFQKHYYQDWIPIFSLLLIKLKGGIKCANTFNGARYQFQKKILCYQLYNKRGLKQKIVICKTEREKKTDG